jgi:glyoxylase-like metal-dependent hydrolase (beta-lactamase superfamily II)
LFSLAGGRIALPIGFPGGVGNTQQDPKRFASLVDDVERRLFDVLPDATWIYPGHGKDTTLGAERPQPRGVACSRVVSRQETSSARPMASTASWGLS